MRPVAIALALAAVLGAALSPQTSVAASQASIFEGPPPFFEFDPSTASSAMGGASAAVFWGEAPNAWANPALLGLASGVRYVDEHSSLLPSGSFPQSGRRMTLGYGGLGLALTGQPFDGLGKLEQRTTIYISDNVGNVQPVSTFDRVRSWSVGASLSECIATAARVRHAEPPGFTRHADLAIGYTEKIAEETSLATILGSGGPPVDRGFSRDLGALVRVGRDWTRGGGDAMPLRLDGAYGLSVQNSAKDEVGFEPLARHLRNALATRVALQPRARWGRTPSPWIAPALTTFLALGLTYEAEHVTAPGSFFGDYDLHHYGAELSLTRVLSFQVGRFESATRYAATTWGVGVTLPVGEWGGARYAYASVPVDPVVDSGSIPHRSWSVWLDPVALARK